MWRTAERSGSRETGRKRRDGERSCGCELAGQGGNVRERPVGGPSVQPSPHAAFHQISSRGKKNIIIITIIIIKPKEETCAVINGQCASEEAPIKVLVYIIALRS